MEYKDIESVLWSDNGKSLLPAVDHYSTRIATDMMMLERITRGVDDA